MTQCETFLLALALVILADAAIFFNVHRLVRVPEDLPPAIPGEMSPRERQIAMLRRAVGMSIAAVLLVFGYLLASLGCFV